MWISQTPARTVSRGGLRGRRIAGARACDVLARFLRGDQVEMGMDALR
jgi:hypothetical protein